MRIVLSFLLLASLIACSKKHDDGNPAPPAAIDTLTTGWKKVDLPQAGGGADVFFFDNTTGFAAAGNFIYRSTDGGNSWQKAYRPTYPPVNIAMGSTANAIFTTNINNAGTTTMLFTTNGGASFDSTIVADIISDAFFVSSTAAYAIGYKIWKTTNGGHDWTSVSSLGSSAFGYETLHFINDQTGWWTGTAGIFKTTNGGVSWTQEPSTGFNLNISSVYFVDANTGYVGDQDGVGKTTNGGANWIRVATFPPGYHDVHFVSLTTGWVTDGHYIRKTTDGGATWTKEVVLPNDDLIELHFTDINHGWAIYKDHVLKYEKQ